MSKKITSNLKMIIGCVMILLLYPTIVFAAEPSFAVSSNVQSVLEGEAVDVVVSIQGNEGIESAAFDIAYDNTVLQYIGYDWDSSVSENEGQISEWDDAVEISLVSENGYTGNGTLVTLHFQAIGNAEGLSFPINVFDVTEYEWAADTEEEESTQEEVDEDTQEEVDPDDDEDSDWEDDTEQETTSKKTDDKKNTNSTKTTSDNSAASTSVSEGQTENGYTPVATTQSNNTAVLSSKADKNYKTGMGLGEDWYLLIAATTGITCLLLLARKWKYKG